MAEPSMTEEQLRERLARFDALLPELIAKYQDEADFWNAVAGETDFATEGASATDFEWVNAEIDALLLKHGVSVPRDEAPVDG